MAAGSLMRHLPNAITIARLGSVPVLLALAQYRKETAFAVLLFIALGSDVIDGWLARTLRVVSPAGAMLDSIASFVEGAGEAVVMDRTTELLSVGELQGWAG